MANQSVSDEAQTLAIMLHDIEALDAALDTFQDSKVITDAPTVFSQGIAVLTRSLRDSLGHARRTLSNGGNVQTS